MQRFSYAFPAVPATYNCGQCGVTHVKLWRVYRSFDAPQLRCATCAAKEQHVDISDIDENGLRGISAPHRTDQIGSYVPAVPFETDVGYWGYMTMPTEGINWWRSLQTLKT